MNTARGTLDVGAMLEVSAEVSVFPSPSVSDGEVLTTTLRGREGIFFKEGRWRGNINYIVC